MTDICKEFENGICYNDGECLVIGSGDAIDSFVNLSQKHSHKKLVAMESRLKTLSAKGWLRSPDQFKDEGDNFFAVKTHSGFRAYGWFSTYKEHRCFIISHFILKKSKKLKAADKKRMKSIKQQWELDHGGITHKPH